MPTTTTNHYVINSKQLDILRLLYRLRFATSQHLSTALDLDPGVMNEYLQILLDRKYIGRNYDGRYKIHGQPEYYLLESGIKAIKQYATADAELTRGGWLKLRLLLVMCGSTAAVLLIAGALWHFVSPSIIKNPFSSTVTTSVQFPLYYPDRLPAGYRLDASSIKQPQNGVITYDLINNMGATIYISEEAIPPKDVLDTFTGNLVNPTTFQTPLGQAMYGALASHEASAASLVTGNKTWIIINADSSVPTDSFRILLQNLRYP